MDNCLLFDHKIRTEEDSAWTLMRERKGWKEKKHDLPRFAVVAFCNISVHEGVPIPTYFDIDMQARDTFTDEVCLGDPTPSKESGVARTNVSADADTQANVMKATTVKLEKITSGSITDQSYESYESKTPGKFNALHIVFQSLGPIDRSKMLSRVNTLTEQNEA
ncbi:hypothetical protein DCAR_0205516 [Daucus carota subsp. sativus]|uniref:Uncharacterized protein n=1 Tax=Daucus carota subsp. sativus TaxID=79200 RepID=A0AAF0WB36_DAUCS|nr:hypothetical protein DCAR_0205516 [Daucus carota subsp. sativus]